MAYKNPEDAKRYQREWARRNYHRLKATSGLWAQTEEGKRWKREWAARRYEVFKTRLNAIKLESGCIDCGYKESPSALQFDHRDPVTKRTEVSTMFMWAWPKVLVEIEKCDVRCANCHAIRTFEEGHHRGGSNRRVGAGASGFTGDREETGSSDEGDWLRLFEVADP